MTVRVGINGFGRMGRNFGRAVAASDHDIEIVAANDLGDVATMAHLLKYDSVLGRVDQEVKVTGEGLEVGGSLIKILAEKDPGKLPWSGLGVILLARPGHSGRRLAHARRRGWREEGHHLRTGQG